METVGRRVRLLWVCPLRATQAHVLLKSMGWESTNKTLNRIERWCCEGIFWIWPSFFACELVQFIFLCGWVKKCYFYSCMSVWIFVLRCLMLLIVPLLPKFLVFFVGGLPHNCYYYYCIVTNIVLLLYCNFIWQLLGMLCTMKVFLCQKCTRKPICIYIYTRNIYIYIRLCAMIVKYECYRY